MCCLKRERRNRSSPTSCVTFYTLLFVIAAKRKALEDKYNAELNSKREVIEKDYAKKLGDIDKSITTIISNKAKAEKYDLVLAKGIVIYGGTDITALVKQNIK